PGLVPDPLAQQARHDHRDHKVGGQRAEPHPDRPVRPDERDQGLLNGDPDVVVDHRGADMQREQHKNEQRDVAVQTLGDEPRPACAGQPGAGDDAEHHAHREQGQCDDPAGPGQVPGQLRVAEQAAHARSSRSLTAASSRSAGQPATRCTVPDSSTRRDGSPSAASQSGARRPRTIAAVLAVFAPTQLAAVTVTVRQTGSAGRPVRGSSTWWKAVPPRRQRRTAVLDVARPPPCIRTTGPACPGVVTSSRAVSSVSRTGQPAGGTGPAAARSPPTLTRTPAPVSAAIAAAARSTASAFAVAPRSSAVPGGIRIASLLTSISRHAPGGGGAALVAGPSAGR